MKLRKESEHFANVRYLAQSNALYENTDSRNEPQTGYKWFAAILLLGFIAYLAWFKL